MFLVPKRGGAAAAGQRTGPVLVLCLSLLLLLLDNHPECHDPFLINVEEDMDWRAAYKLNDSNSGNFYCYKLDQVLQRKRRGLGGVKFL